MTIDNIYNEFTEKISAIILYQSTVRSTTDKTLKDLEKHRYREGHNMFFQDIKLMKYITMHKLKEIAMR